jgi:hypothetical protein
MPAKKLTYKQYNYVYELNLFKDFSIQSNIVKITNSVPISEKA